MNKAQIDGQLLQFKGKLRQKWGQLTDDHVEEVKGNAQVLSGKLQKLYGITKEAAEKQIHEFCETVSKETKKLIKDKH